VRIAIVIPWFGRDLIGGAERHAWELSHALAEAGATVDVLATCCRSFNDDWATNFHRAGTTKLAEGLQLIRFRVDSRDRVAFHRVTSALTSLPEIMLHGDYEPLDERDARTFVSENINSRAMSAYVVDNAALYDAVIFLPYLYGTTLSIAPQIADKAFLLPCLHDESYAYLTPVRACMAKMRGLLFNSLGEEETAASIYGPGIFAKSRVIGGAVAPVVPPRAPVRLRNFVPQRSRYVLYLGRQVATKNIDLLISAFELYRERRSATSLQLVLAGSTNVDRSGDGIIDLGAVSEVAKAALLTYARALAQPSIHESFSRAIYESWLARRPVIVNGRCRATARAVEESGGGWIVSTVEEWADIFAELDESSDEAVDAVGERGWAAALENGTWATVAQRVLDAIAPARALLPARVDQVVPLGARAITGYAEALDGALRAAGVDTSTIIAETHTEREDSFALAHVANGIPGPADAYVAHSGELASLPRHAPVFAASHAVATALEQRGIVSRVLPLPVSPAGWDGIRPSHRRWLEHHPVVLSIAPLNAQDARHLLDVFVAFLGSANHARLLVFEACCDDDARAILLKERSELDLASEVEFVGETPAERYAAYRAASVAVAIGRPLDVPGAVMPLWFDIPIVALGESSAADSVESSGLIEERFEPRRFAALLRIVTTDSSLRAAMQQEGRRSRERHLPRSIVTALFASGPMVPSRIESSVDARRTKLRPNA
jgi:glycosyltransferase involved in cell wall biosynthesis